MILLLPVPLESLIIMIEVENICILGRDSNKEVG